MFEIDGLLEPVMTGIYITGDRYRMNWVREGKQWGSVNCPEGIKVTVCRKITDKGRLLESYVFENTRTTDVFLLKDAVGISVPLPDNYTSARICMKNRCHAHIWCGGETSYIRAERMGGEAPHLGLVLTNGALTGYSTERDLSERSNDRGVFILHPEISHLLPGEKAEISWELFSFDDREAFESVLAEYTHILRVSFDRTVAFAGERTKMVIHSAYPEINVTANGVPVKVVREDNQFTVCLENIAPGEITWMISAGGHSTFAKTLVLPELDDLFTSRCRFIALKQQYHDPRSALDGAFQIYDNEEERLYYDKNYDHNGGRERVVMGAVLAMYLQKHTDAEVSKALEKYTAYVRRELYDAETGIVYNDIQRDNTWHRLYNYPWVAILFMERFRMSGDRRDLMDMYRVIKTYYAQGGAHFYAIGVPMLESVTLLQENGLGTEALELLALYREHGRNIMTNGLDYPAHEVNYEQSIVAPATSYMFQLYLLTGEKEYLHEGRKQLKVLLLFNGTQPDYHLYENAIRHWDGYWFGKRRLFGDTFPHYWSALTGMAMHYATMAGEKGLAERSENSLRGVLSMFAPDGSATCAYLYPDNMNGCSGKYRDPWANDQDWGLYYYIKAGMSTSKVN